jgi:hypothetical protein
MANGRKENKMGDAASVFAHVHLGYRTCLGRSLLDASQWLQWLRPLKGSVAGNASFQTCM